ncbi:hypothetical protein EVAR_24228_1 [Eumeta japonica]|uniref:Uncharacterized protein n=1 Tax=Eumeta variegata TaxID=151549 RepID=A0A4C1W786_EUMVA|nr:hypothetical protein EVAR_24228_1 [Eumeta japonica]
MTVSKTERSATAADGGGPTALGDARVSRGLFAYLATYSTGAGGAGGAVVGRVTGVRAVVNATEIARAARAPARRTAHLYGFDAQILTGVHAAAEQSSVSRGRRYDARNSTALNCLRMIQCAALTLPDPSLSTRALLFYAIATLSW